MEQYFPYGETEIAYLKSKDKRLGEVIDKLGGILITTQKNARKPSAFDFRAFK